MKFKMQAQRIIGTTQQGGRLMSASQNDWVTAGLARTLILAAVAGIAAPPGTFSTTKSIPRYMARREQGTLSRTCVLSPRA